MALPLAHAALPAHGLAQWHMCQLADMEFLRAMEAEENQVIDDEIWGHLDNYHDGFLSWDDYMLLRLDYEDKRAEIADRFTRLGLFIMFEEWDDDMIDI